VTIIDPWRWLETNDLLRRLHFQTGYVLASPFIDERLWNSVAPLRPDIIWVNQGELLGRTCLERLRTLGAPIINYANDNPFSSESRRRFWTYRRSLDLYDAVVVVFQHAVSLAEAAGARRVMRVFISADEVAHLAKGEKALPKLHDVGFVGTWMPDGRGDFVRQLMARGIPIAIWGDRWHRDPQWKTLRTAWRGPGVYDDDGYASLIRQCKICLGLLNHTAGNQHTDRSIQIPALGTVLCAERTAEHVGMYDEGVEALFWSTPEECADKCRRALQDQERLAVLARRGRERAIRNQLFNEPTLQALLSWCV
jgi:hypothetical protein